MIQYRPAIGKVALTAALVGVLVWRVDFGAVAAAARQLSFSNWLINVLLLFGAILLGAGKWKLLLPEQPLGVLLKLNLIGQFYGMLLPGHVAGEAVKAYRLGRGKQNAEQIAASVVVDRVTGFIGLLSVALCGAAFSETPTHRQIFIVLLTATLLGVAVLFSFRLPWWHRALSALSKRGPRAHRIAGQFERLLSAWRTAVQRTPLIVASVACGAVVQLVAIWINSRIGYELGLQIALVDWCWIFGVVTIVTALPFTIGGLGLREGSFVGSLALVNSAPEKAVALSLAVFSLLLVAAAIGGVVDWARAPKTLIT